jgi:outer membrane protein assembly factor BamB
MSRLLPLLASLAVLLAAADWPQFRGPNSAGVAEDFDLPFEFGPEKNVVWKTAVPRGHSSPSIAGNRIFLTAIDGQTLQTLALDRATGKILWRREAPRPRRQELQDNNSPASATPATDGKNAYVFFADFGLLAYGPDGNELWRMPLGPFNNPFGHGASPVLAGDTLLMLCDQDTDAFLVAVDKNTGRVRWRVAREHAQRGYATPVLYTPPGGKPQAIVAGSYRMSGYDIETGKEVWWIRGLPWQIKPTPVLAVEGGNTRVYFVTYAGESDPGQQRKEPPFPEALKTLDTDKDGRLSLAEIPDFKARWELVDLDRSGFLEERDWRHYQERRQGENALRAYRLGGSGDLTESHFLWKNPRSLPNVPSPLFYRGMLYTLKEGGILTSFDIQTGEILKQARLEGAPGAYYASPVASGGRLYTISEEGKLSVIEAGAQWKTLAVNDMGEDAHSTPAILDGRIYVRTHGTLYCFAQR